MEKLIKYILLTEYQKFISIIYVLLQNDYKTKNTFLLMRLLLYAKQTWLTMTVTMVLTLLLTMFSIPAMAEETWIDVTEQYLTNPGFTNNSSQGWTWTSDANSQTVRCECMEFWNGKFNIYQVLKGLSKGKYRLSVQSYYRCRDNNKGLRDYENGQESITAMMYADDTQQKLTSVYSFYFNEYVNGSWSPDWVRFYPNTMESAREAFDKGAYWNEMVFETEGGDVKIGLVNDNFIQSNWCIFTNFRLEKWGELVSATALTLKPETAELTTGEQLKLTATISPEDVTFKKIDWKSSNESIATVDDNGNVSTLADGTVTITATTTDGSGISARCSITVKDNPATASSLIVNEIMASNIDEYISPAFNFDGWIELYNPTDKAVSLKGLYMSDDMNNLTQWQLKGEHGVLPAKGFKVIWFDSNDLNPLNTPFKLDTDGGTIYISDQTGKTIIEQAYPASSDRTAHARTTDGGDTWGTTAQPTPGYSNASSTFAVNMLDAPVVDTDSRLFEEVLTIHVTIPEGTTLRYTSDGTLPTMTNGKNSYTGEFVITETKNYRFRLFQEGMLPSAVTTRSYILRDKDYQLPVLSVVSDPRFLYDDSIGVMVRGVNGKKGNGQNTPCNWNMDWNRPVNFSYILPDGQMAICQDVNLEMAGGWSRAYTPHSFKLKGNKELGGNKNLNYPFFKAKPYIRNRTLQIRNGGNDNNCRFKDAAIETIIQTTGIDIDLQSYQPVHEFINGQYIGVLNVREPNNKHYVYANYGWDEEEIDQFEMSPDSGYVQKCGTEESFNLVYDLSAKAGDEAIYEEIKNLVDIDEYINYMAMEFYLGSTDWPQNNIKGFTRTENGKFRFVSFDLDFAFNATTSTFNQFVGKQTYTFDWLYDEQRQITAEIKFVTIFLNMLKNSDFRRQFIDTYCVMGGSVFDPERTTAIVDSLLETVNPMMQLTGESASSTANNIKNSFVGRMEKMMPTLQAFEPMQLTDITLQSAVISSNIPNAQIMLNNTIIPTGKFNGKLFAPVKLKAVTPAGYVFKGWRNMDSSSEIYYSKKEETDIPLYDFNLRAEYRNMTEEELMENNFHPVTINEVSASNDVMVNDYFKKADWLELYNNTNEDIDIEGMYLTNDPEKPKKYCITKGTSMASTVIPAYGRLIVWCDKQNPVTQLHASFKLAAEGGYVGLTAADESWTDHIYYTQHDGFSSIGRYPDGGASVYWMHTPTIGKRNVLTNYTVDITDQQTTGIRSLTASKEKSLSIKALCNRLIIQSEAEASVSILTLSGQNIMTRKVHAGESILSLESLPYGCYIAICTDSRGKTVSCKTIKN